MTAGGVAADRRLSRFALAWWGLVLSLLSMVAVAVFCVVVTSMSLVLAGIGVPLFLLTVRWLRGLADWHRWWLAEYLRVPVPRPYRPVPAGGCSRRTTAVLTDPATWRDLLWTLVDSTVGITLAIIPIALLLNALWYLVALPILVGVTPGVFARDYGIIDANTVGKTVVVGMVVASISFVLFRQLTRPLLAAYARLCRYFLAPAERDRLARRIAQLTESRAETVDTQAAELRRIERDLHDGAQARLVSLGMSLGLAENLLASDPDAAGELLAEAREATGLALAELRDLVRGIHPPVLADRGLDGAVRALALANPLPVEVTIDLPGRPPAPAESAMYFAVAEILTNAAKHSGATSAWLRLTYGEGKLAAMIGDDGRGGAVQSGGGGLAGVERRLSAFDGTMMVASPVGGPTIVTMELPCELSSVKTSPSFGTA